MNIFKESRFVFDGVEDDHLQMSYEIDEFTSDMPFNQSVEGRKSIKVKDTAVKARAGLGASVEAAKEGKSTPEVVAGKVKAETGQDLEEIKVQLGPVYGVQRLERISSLKGFKTKLEYVFSQDLYEKDFNREDLKGEILDYYKKNEGAWANLRPLGGQEGEEAIPDKSGNMMDIMATAASVSMMKKIEIGIKARQKFYDKWISEGKGPVYVSVEGVRGIDFKVVFSKKFEDALNANEEALKEKKAAEVKEKAPDSIKLQQFIDSPIGKIFAWLPGYKTKDGKIDREKFAAILNGTDWFGAFIVGLFGYSEFGGEFYDSVKEMLPDNVKKSLGPLELRARATKYSAEAWRKTDNYKDGMGKEAEAVKKEVDIIRKKFGEDYLDGDSTVPKDGIKLTEGVSLDNKYTILIKTGAKITIPAGEFLTLDGEKVFAGKDKVKEVEIKSDKKEFIISGAIPIGTVFAAVKFEKIEAADGDSK